MADEFEACSVDICNSPAFAKGYCGSHYMRMRRHGDPLAGRTPEGEPLRFVHEVAIHHTGTDCLTWPFGKIAAGYGTVRVDGKILYTHRYICELVRGAPPTPEHEAAHSCGKGHESCISPIHLDWKTPAQNQADRIDHGTHARGERHVGAKLTEAAVREIIALRGIETQIKLAERFGVSPASIAGIHSGRNWSWVSEEDKGKAA